MELEGLLRGEAGSESGGEVTGGQAEAPEGVGGEGLLGPPGQQAPGGDARDLGETGRFAPGDFDLGDDPAEEWVGGAEVGRGGGGDEFGGGLEDFDWGAQPGLGGFGGNTDKRGGGGESDRWSEGSEKAGGSELVRRVFAPQRLEEQRGEERRAARQREAAEEARVEARINEAIAGKVPRGARFCMGGCLAYLWRLAPFMRRADRNKAIRA